MWRGSGWKRLSGMESASGDRLFDELGNSSEASACIAYQPGPIVFQDGFEGD